MRICSPERNGVLPDLEILEQRLLLASNPVSLTSEINDRLDNQPAISISFHTETERAGRRSTADGPIEVARHDHSATNAFERLNPLGGMMFVSSENTGLIPSADDTQDFEVFVEADQTIAAVVEPWKPNVTVSVQLIGVDPQEAPYIALSPGATAILPPTWIASTGTYTVRVGGNDTSGFSLKLLRNASIEEHVGDSADGNELSIDDSFVPVGLGRFGVVGNSVPQTIRDGAVVWGVQSKSGQIIQIDPENGSVDATFSAPGSLAPNHRQIGLSIADGGQSLIYINADDDASTLYRLDPDSGSALSTETVPNSLIDGLAFKSAGGPFTIYSENFDDPTHSFTFNNKVGGGTGMWHLSTGRQLDGLANHSPPQNIYFGDFEDDFTGGDYMNLNLNGTRGAAISPVISLPSAGTITLKFNHVLGTDPDTDPFDGEDDAEVQVDAGSGFVTILSNQDGSLPRSTGGSWQNVTADLTPFAGSDITFRFWFNARDLFDNFFEGWFVDDIQISYDSSSDVTVYYSETDTGVMRQEGYSGQVSTHVDGDAIDHPVGGLGGDDTGRLFGFFDDGLIHEIDPFVTDTFLSQLVPPATDIEGVAFDGASLYLSTASGDLYRMNPNDGSVLSVFSVPNGALYGLAARGGSVSNLPDIDEYEIDLTGKFGEPIDIVLSGQIADFSDQTLELLDVDGQSVVATATSNPLGVDAMNYDLAILDFIVPHDGVYTLRLTSTAAGEYGLIVTDPITFDSEPNDDLNEPLRSLSQTGMALGLLGGDFDDGFIFFEDFDGGLEGFVIDNNFGSGGGLWHLSKGRQSDGDPEHSPPDSLYYGQSEDDQGNGNYDTSSANGGTVISPPITLPADGPITLSFHHLLETEGRTISDIAEVSVNDGNGFVLLLSSSNGSLPTGTGGRWQRAQADLSEFAGADITLRFSFETLDSVNNTFEGWYIDDVAIIEGVPVPDDPLAFNVRKLSQVRLNDIPGSNGAANDIWGYVSPSGREYALLGLHRGSAYIDVTTPENPVVVGFIAGPDEFGASALATSLCHDDCEEGSDWRDLKFYEEYAYITNETAGGLQIVDLTDIDNGTVSEVRTITQSGLQTAHNVAVNLESGFAYLTGANIANGGLVVLDLAADPTNPQIVATWDDRYIHDVDVITYTEGPFAGREIAFGFAEGSGIIVIDVTDKSNMFTIAIRSYPNLTYTHYGAISEDRRHLFVNDELDELQAPNVSTTTTYVFNIEDPADPQYVTSFTNGLPAIDHNLRVRGDFLFEANYRSGLRIYDVRDVSNVQEVGFYDTYPSDDGRHFNGAWGVYTDLPSEVILLSDIEGGLFVLDASEATANVGTSTQHTSNNPSHKPSGEVKLARHPVSHAHDLYTLDLSANDLVTITTHTLFDDPATTPLNELDPSLIIFDSQGLQIAEDDNSLDGKNAMVMFIAPTTGRYTIQVLTEIGTGEYVIKVDTSTTAEVVGRHIFYNNSSFDGNNVSANANDDMAISPVPANATNPRLGKTALLPGQSATFGNYTSYSRGINGLMIDVLNLTDPDGLSAGDFHFHIGNDDLSETWAEAPQPLDVDVRRGAGVNGSDRVSFVWNDNAIENKWLQVTALANERTGLAKPDVHYWGNAIGDSGDNPVNTQVNSTDELAARFNQHDFLNPAPIDDFVDFDRDGRVNATDELIARFNDTNFLTALQLITTPAQGVAIGSQTLPPLPRVETHDDTVSLLALAKPIGNKASNPGTLITKSLSHSDHWWIRLKSATLDAKSPQLYKPLDAPMSLSLNQPIRTSGQTLL